MSECQRIASNTITLRNSCKQPVNQIIGVALSDWLFDVGIHIPKSMAKIVYNQFDNQNIVFKNLSLSKRLNFNMIPLGVKREY